MSTIVQREFKVYTCRLKCDCGSENWKVVLIPGLAGDTSNGYRHTCIKCGIVEKHEHLYPRQIVKDLPSPYEGED